MRRNTIGLTAAALAAAGAVAVAGAAVASAADDGTSTPSPSATGSAPGGSGPGDAQGPSQDTAVTGAEADKVVAAVTAKDSAASIDTVRKDPDGSYDALGTKDGNPVFYDVSGDLATVTQRTGGPGGHGPGGGASKDTAVAGAEADKVVAAVKAKDSAASIDTVRKDPDGSYDALGTKDGNPVFYDVSADLATVTQRTGGPGGMPGGMPGGAPRGNSAGGSTDGSTSGSTSGSDSSAANTAYAV